MARVYVDVAEKTEIQSTLATFIGYQIKDKVIAGVEYNFRFNENFDKDIIGMDIQIYCRIIPLKNYKFLDDTIK